MKSSKEIFIENLKTLRKGQYPNQADFAPVVGFSTRGYQKYEQGESDPTPDILDLFGEALGVSPVDLISPKSPEGRALPRTALVSGLVEMLPTLNNGQVRDLYDLARKLAAIKK